MVSPRRDRPIARGPFSRAGAELMPSDVPMVASIIMIVVVIACQQLENALENAALRPSTEALVRDLPVAEVAQAGHARGFPV